MLLYCILNISKSRQPKSFKMQKVIWLCLSYFIANVLLPRYTLRYVGIYAVQKFHVVVLVRDIYFIQHPAQEKWNRQICLSVTELPSKVFQNRKNIKRNIKIRNCRNLLNYFWLRKLLSVYFVWIALVCFVYLFSCIYNVCHCFVVNKCFHINDVLHVIYSTCIQICRYCC